MIRVVLFKLEGLKITNEGLKGPFIRFPLSTLVKLSEHPILHFLFLHLFFIEMKRIPKVVTFFIMEWKSFLTVPLLIPSGKPKNLMPARLKLVAAPQSWALAMA